jgi:hypothetical protein
VLFRSWEVFYKDVETDDGGVQWLKDCSTRAATLVGNPAYAGRTSVLALAAVWTTKFINDLPDSAFLYVEDGGSKDKDGKTTPRSLRHFPYKDAEGNVDLPHLRNALARIPQASIPAEVKSRLTKKAQGILAKHGKKGESSMEIEELEKELETLKTEKKSLEDKLAEEASMHDELETLRKEVEDLRAYKSKVEADAARAALTKKRLTQFGEAGIEMTEETFTAEADKWLGLDDAAFEFVLKALVNTKPVKREGQSNSSVEDTDNEADPKVIVRKLLQERKTPKQKDKES